jgi:hypothetical protein
LLTDHPKTVTFDRAAGVPVRHSDIVARPAHRAARDLIVVVGLIT